MFSIDLFDLTFTYVLFFRRLPAWVVWDGRSWESSGRASASGLMSPTTGVAFLRARATSCSRSCLIKLISRDDK